MKTVSELNEWISRFFIALDGAKMAYVSFPIDISINGAARQVEHRVTFGTIAIAGPEDLCCQAVTRELLLHVPRKEGKLEILLIRQPFTYDAASQSIYGRIAFWDSHRQKQLSFSRIYKPEGCITLHVSEL